MVINLFLVQGEYENTIIIQKSEFICRIYRVNSIQEVNEKLNYIRKKHYDATHNCYAYILGENQDIQKASDDGEPSKTAGAPMIDVLKKKGLTNILAIVTRYFGGILLGAGGLVRAYSSSISECLKGVKIYVPKLQKKFILTTSYSGYNTILNIMNKININNVSFQKDVIIEGSTDIDYFEELKDDLYKYKIEASSLTEVGNDIIETYVDTLV